MNTDVEALKELYAKMGGDDDVAAINTSSEMIRKLGEVVNVSEGGGESRPSTNDEIEIPLGEYNSYLRKYALGGGYTFDSILSLIKSGKRNLVIKRTRTGAYEEDLVFRYSYYRIKDPDPGYESTIVFSCIVGTGEQNVQLLTISIDNNQTVDWHALAFGSVFTPSSGGPITV